MSPVPVKGKAAPAVGFDLFNIDAYSTGGGMPEGDYCIKDASVKMHTHTKQDGTPAGPERLGVMITLCSLVAGEGEDREQFYSMGSKAHESWEPTEDGKGVLPVAGGPGTAPNKNTNWAVFVQSLLDSGLPHGVLTDLSGLDGTWVHMQNVPEPSDRKSFKAQTGEAAVEDKPRTIAVVSEIKEDGKPWEGGGGVPEAVAPKAAAKSAKPAATAKAVTKAAAPAKSASAPSPSNGAGDYRDATVEAISAVLGENEDGMPQLQLRTAAFKHIKEATDDATAKAACNHYFNNPANLNEILGELGYQAAKGKVEKAA